MSYTEKMLQVLEFILYLVFCAILGGTSSKVEIFHL